jgi:hypothetical protein
MGGDVDHVLKTQAKVVRRFKLRGLALACVEGPANRFRCCECVTGAIVTAGFSSADAACKSVHADIKSGKPSEMRDQIKRAKYHVSSLRNETKPEAEFWRMLGETSK